MTTQSREGVIDFLHKRTTERIFCVDVTKCFQLNAITVQWHDCPDAIVYQQCRQRSNFTLYSCQVGTVINILSATAEVRLTWWRQRWQCSRWASLSCTRSIINYSAIVRCNGQRACNFSSDVLDYPQHNITRLCGDHEDGNFVRIVYNCNRSKKHVNMSLLKTYIFSTPHTEMLTV